MAAVAEEEAEGEEVDLAAEVVAEGLEVRKDKCCFSTGVCSKTNWYSFLGFMMWCHHIWLGVHLLSGLCQDGFGKGSGICAGIHPVTLASCNHFLSR